MGLMTKRRHRHVCICLVKLNSLRVILKMCHRWHLARTPIPGWEHKAKTDKRYMLAPFGTKQPKPTFGVRKTVQALRGLARRAGGRAARAAMLLYPAIRAQLRDAPAHRAALSHRLATVGGGSVHVHAAAAAAPPPAVERAAPAPTFACPACGSLWHSARDARVHCRSGFGVKRRRL